SVRRTIEYALYLLPASGANVPMTDSHLFSSSCSRRQLARRRPGRSPLPSRLLLLLGLAAAVTAAAFLAASGGL
ncbi:MAG: hypothetical protein ABI323_05860, partial [Solirubrobacteraceae bacterium]